MGKLNVGDYISDFVGPLGEPSEIENFGWVVQINIYLEKLLQFFYWITLYFRGKLTITYNPEVHTDDKEYGRTRQVNQQSRIGQSTWAATV